MQPSFLVDVEDDSIISITPVTEDGRRQKPLFLSVQTAEDLREALKQAVMLAKVRFWT